MGIYVKINLDRSVVMEFFFLIILLVLMFDMAKFRKQNQTLIEQNEKVISLLEEKTSNASEPNLIEVLKKGDSKFEIY